MFKKYGLYENFAGSEVHVAVISLEDSLALLWRGTKKILWELPGFCFALLLFYYEYLLLQTQVKITLQRRIEGKNHSHPCLSAYGLCMVIHLLGVLHGAQWIMMWGVMCCSLNPIVHP